MQFDTNETGFTPGPWRLDTHVGKDDAPDIVTEGRTCRIAELDTFAYGKTGRNILANGRLIAAAPAMFEALQRVARAEWVKFAPKYHSDGWRIDMSSEDLRAVNDALALAQGKPPIHPHDEPLEIIELPDETGRDERDQT